MKLSEALIERAELKETISRIKQRMENNAKVQEGDKPTEDIENLFLLYHDLTNKLESIIIRINKTNNATEFGETTLSEAIVMRDIIKDKISAFKHIYNSLFETRYSRNEIKYVRIVNIETLQNNIDGLSKQYRKLDMAIQELNWTVDLVE